MNHCVPDFENDQDYLLPVSSNSKRHKKSTMGDEDIMELLWHNGQVVMQSQHQRATKKPETTPSNLRIDDDTTPCNLYIQEDEMASWLHYPNDDNLDLYLHSNDMLYPVMTSSTPSTTVTPAVPPPTPPANVMHFSRPKNLNISGSDPESSNKVSEVTVVENERAAAKNIGFRGNMMTSSATREQETYDVRSSTSSPGPGGSGATASVEPAAIKKSTAVTEGRKRKGREMEENECYSEDVEFDYPEAKKRARGSTSTKRTRAAEVHNLSERRRRDRINEKMKALQELIPRCNKSDKASMLDEAIEYLKSLQMQVQMMSMGYSMVPMMFPGVQRYMPPMAATGMGMGMGMDQVGMNSHMVPYPAVLPGPPMPNPAAAAAAAHLSQRFPVPRFPMPQVPVMGPTRSQDPMMNPFPLQNANQPRVPFDPYQQYIGLPQTQLPQQQNQTSMPAVTKMPSSSKDVREPGNHPTG